MSNLTKTHAETIAKKLEATYKQGADHLIAILHVNGVYIAQFGIRRGKKGLPHDYIARQIFFPLGQCLKLAQCTLNRPDWIKALQDQGMIPKEPAKPATQPSAKTRKPRARKK